MPLARLLDQAVRALHAHGYRDGLFPAQWAAVRYFSGAEPARSTAIHLARFQGLSFGAVARTVRTLIEKGYLRKAGSAGRGRAEMVVVTALGRDLMERDPLLSVEAVVADLPQSEQEALANALAAILAHVQSGGETESFPVEPGA